MAGLSNADELKKLAELRDSGVLSEEEFAAQKAKLLASPAAAAPPPSPTVAQSAATPSQGSKARNQRRGCLLSVLGLIVVVVIIVAIVSSGSGGGKFTITLQGGGATTSSGFGQTPGAAPNWGAGGNVEPISKSDLRIYFTVKNTGSGAGTPSCQITAASPGDSDYGVDQVSPTSPIQPGGEWNNYDDITVTNNGVMNVTKVTLSC